MDRSPRRNGFVTAWVTSGLLLLLAATQIASPDPSWSSATPGRRAHRSAGPAVEMADGAYAEPSVTVRLVSHVVPTSLLFAPPPVPAIDDQDSTNPRSALAPERTPIIRPATPVEPAHLPSTKEPLAQAAPHQGVMIVPVSPPKNSSTDVSLPAPLIRPATPIRLDDPPSPQLDEITAPEDVDRHTPTAADETPQIEQGLPNHDGGPGNESAPVQDPHVATRTLSPDAGPSAPTSHGEANESVPEDASNEFPLSPRNSPFPIPGPIVVPLAQQPDSNMSASPMQSPAQEASAMRRIPATVDDPINDPTCEATAADALDANSWPADAANSDEPTAEHEPPGPQSLARPDGGSQDADKEPALTTENLDVRRLPPFPESENQEAASDAFSMPERDSAFRINSPASPNDSQPANPVEETPPTAASPAPAEASSHLPLAATDVRPDDEALLMRRLPPILEEAETAADSIAASPALDPLAQTPTTTTFPIQRPDPSDDSPVPAWQPSRVEVQPVDRPAFSSPPAQLLIPLSPQQVSGDTSPRGIQDPASMAHQQMVFAAVIDRKIDELSCRAEGLASRGAFYAARAEMIKALRVVTQALDSQRGGSEYSRALSRAMRALQEAADFAPVGSRLEGELDLSKLAKAHRTPVLHGEHVDGLAPLAAQQRYLEYAQQQFVAASAGCPAASRALYGLARIYMVLDRVKLDTQTLCLPTAVVMHQAALLVDPRNNKAANELGVLLARFGQWEDARRAFLHSLTIRPEAESWRNLAVVHSRLGELELARRAMLECDAAVARRNQQPGEGNSQPVTWVSPREFSESGGSIGP